MAIKPWKCPCNLGSDAEYVAMQRALNTAHLNAITRQHWSKGWHALGRQFSFTKVDVCSYCKFEHKCLVFIEDAAARLYKCDVCYHLGATVRPEDGNYTGSAGHQVALVKAQKRAAPSVSPPRTLHPREEILETPPKKKRTYGIYGWKTQ